MSNYELKFMLTFQHTSTLIINLTIKFVKHVIKEILDPNKHKLG